jgi:hypothetical protein
VSEEAIMQLSKEMVVNYFMVESVIGDGPVTELCDPPEDMIESKPILGFSR